MGTLHEFIGRVDKSTSGDQPARVTERDKAEHDCWEGSRQTGHGGDRYDSRRRKLAYAMEASYGRWAACWC